MVGGSSPPRYFSSRPRGEMIDTLVQVTLCCFKYHKRRSMAEKTECATPGCEETFVRYPSHIRRGVKTHCSSRCAGKHRRMTNAAMAEQADARALGALDPSDHGSSNLPSRTCCEESRKEEGRERCSKCSRWLEKRTYKRPRGLRDNEPQKSLLGLSRNELTRLRELQDDVCAICGKSCTSSKRLAIDHNHETEVIRGLLCIS